MGRISRPLLDRMDICVEAPPVGYADMKANDRSESSAEIRERVKEAWERQRRRFQNSGIFFNSQMTGREVKHFCRMEVDAEELMEQFFGQMKLSARAYHKVLKVARTIADLAGNQRKSARIRSVRHLRIAILTENSGNEYDLTLDICTKAW